VRDLARLASVDASTISRALNHDPRINDERAQKIRDLAQQVGYKPRPLRSKFARSVGLLVASAEGDGLAEQFLERIAWSAQRLLGERRLHANLECVPQNRRQELPAVVQQNRVDGVLLAGYFSSELIKKIADFPMPAVAINDLPQRTGVSCVRSDPEPAFRDAILQLAARGHQRFGLLMKRMDYPTAHAKYASYASTLRHISIEPDPLWFVKDLNDDIAGGREGVRQLAERGPLPTVIMCENDWVALGAMHELQRRGLDVPGNVSVIGHDDLWVCEKLDPKLTSVHRAEERIVSRAIDILLEHIEHRDDKTLQDVAIPGYMVWRQSTGPAPDRMHKSK
jgi:DNA-binding LacI/PurR family transcriptional regulator